MLAARQAHIFGLDEAEGGLESVHIQGVEVIDQLFEEIGGVLIGHALALVELHRFLVSQQELGDAMLVVIVAVQDGVGSLEKLLAGGLFARLLVDEIGHRQVDDHDRQNCQDGQHCVHKPSYEERSSESLPLVYPDDINYLSNYTCYRPRCRGTGVGVMAWHGMRPRTRTG